MRKKLLASLLAAVMLVSLLPTSALAAQEDGVTDGGEPSQVCICAALCTEGTVNENCPVCAEDFALCTYEETPADGDENTYYETDGVTDPAVAEVQARIDALPAAEEITADNAEEVAAQLDAIDEAKAALSDEQVELLDVTRYVAAAEALSALAGQPEANEPELLVDTTLYGNCGAPTTEGGAVTDAVKWQLISNNDDPTTYTLTISGNGAMADYDVSSNRAPWYTNLSQEGATTTAYSGKTFANITKVVITSGVTHIGAYAFAYTTVSDIQIADGVTSIGRGAFLWANWLKNISIPSSVTNMHYDSEKKEYYNIFDGAFYLEAVEISGSGSPYQVVQGGVLVGPVQDKSNEYIIINCADNLGGGSTKEITAEGFPENTTMVAAAAFSSCRSLEAITLPDTVTSLGTSVFAKCLSLKEFRVPDGVKTLPQYAFSGCAKLESIDFNNVETISSPVCSSVSTPETDNQTYACSSLKTVVLSKVKEIPLNAFTGSAIESVTIADQAQVHAKAFLNLTSLKNVTFLGGYTIIAASDGNARPFQGCTNIETVTFHSNNANDAEVTISDNMFVDCTKLTSIDLSNVSLKDGKIGENAFKGCTALETVTFAANTKTISKNAFFGCSALTAVDLTSTQTETIEQSAFQNCTSLATLSLPDTGLTAIGVSAFNGNAIKHITIPASVTEVGDSTFANCSALEQVTMSKDWSGKFPNAVKAPTGYAAGMRWYKDGTQVTPASCFTDGSTTPHTFDYVPILFFDVEYNGNYEDYTSQTHQYPYRTIYKASDMSVLTAHTVKDYTDSTLSITAPTGKSFAGWTTSTDGVEVIATTGSTFAENPAPDKSNSGSFGGTPAITLYARWVDSGKTVIANDVIDQSVQTVAYDGVAKSFTVKAAGGKTLPNVDFAVTYQSNEGNAISNPTSAGTYDVIISYQNSETYADFKLTVEGGLVITKAGSTVTPGEGSSAITATYGETIPLTAKVQRTEASITLMAALDTVDFYCGTTLLGSENVTYDNGVGTATLNYDTSKGGIPVGSKQTITAEYGGNVNLNGSYTNQISITLSPAPLTVTGLTAEDRAYDSSTSVTLTGGALSGIINTNDNVSATMPTTGTMTDANVGNGKTVTVPTITLTGKDASKYTLTQPTVTVNISQATYDMSGVTFENVSYPYDGNEHMLTISGTLPDGVSVSYTNNTRTDVGSTTATASFTGDSTNYEAIADKTAILTITEGTSSVAITPSATALTGGGTVKLTVSGVPAGGTVTVTQTDNQGSAAKTLDLTSNGEISVSLSNTTATYTFTVSYGGDSNHAAASATCTVSVTRRSSGGGSSGGSSSSSSTTTETTKNSDGSTTTTVTNKTTGTVTETTKYTDGSSLVVETKKDGTVTTTDTAANGVKVKTVDEPGEDVTATVTIPRSVGTTIVTIPADTTPGTVAVDAKTGEVVKLSVPTEDGVTVKLDGSADLVLVDKSKDFTDTRNHWAEDAIDFATAHGMFGGTSATTFTPDGSMTRGMIAVVLHNLENNPDHAFEGSFDDVHPDSWYADGIHWMVDNGIAGGYGNGKFGADDKITREQLATFLYRYAGVMGYGTSGSSSLSGFTDAGSVSGYATEAMQWAVGNGLIGGMGNGTLAPQGNATRAQVATILMRFIENLTK